MFRPPKYDREIVKYFMEPLESGAPKPLIDRRYPLDQIEAAYRYVETGRKVGTVVISVRPSNS
jgi:NADPH:quinone reductase-like Zn-dependent oxidoreductase